VECFHYFLAANIVKAHINYRQRAQYYKQRLWRLCPPYCKRQVWFLGHVTHMAGEITRFEACLWLATCFRHACDMLTQVCDEVFDQVCSWLEWWNAAHSRHDNSNDKSIQTAQTSANSKISTKSHPPMRIAELIQIQIFVASLQKRGCIILPLSVILPIMVQNGCWLYEKC